MGIEDFLERKFDRGDFGYPTDKGCDICGATPAQVEPRFGYPTCRKHCTVPPVDRKFWITAYQRQQAREEDDQQKRWDATRDLT